MSTQNEQELFVAWLDTPLCDEDRVEYASDAVDMAYIAWKEGRAPLLSRIAELERQLKDGRVAHESALHMWRDHEDAQQSRIDALSKDAERYAEMKAHVGAMRTNGGIGPVSYYVLIYPPASSVISDETDAAIDAAISAREGE